jgi:hypothetical protein
MWSCCSSSYPCGQDEGDCDNDFDCVGNLVCGNKNCVGFPGSTVDCCTSFTTTTSTTVPTTTVTGMTLTILNNQFINGIFLKLFRIRLFGNFFTTLGQSVKNHPFQPQAIQILSQIEA